MTTTKTIVREHEADLVVREVQVAADGVVALTLAAPDGTGLPPWTPGAHIDLILNDTITRQYSLCSNPADPDRWRVGVLRAAESRGGSELVHGLAEGARSGSAARATTSRSWPARVTCSSPAASGSRRSCR